MRPVEKAVDLDESQGTYVQKTRSRIHVPLSDKAEAETQGGL